jgi:hypothetical protein
MAGDAGCPTLWPTMPDEASPSTPAAVVRLVSRNGREHTLRERRARLEDVVANNDRVFAVHRLAADGLEAWRQVAPSESFTG